LALPWRRGIAAAFIHSDLNANAVGTVAMRTIQFDAAGEPAAVLTCVEGEPPQPATGEVVVRMIASPINPSDMMFVRGIYGVVPQLPATPGFEGVGVVERSGGGIRGRLFTGKRVVVLNRTGGNWADFAVVPADRVIPISNRLSDEQAATFFVNPATAWIMTKEVLNIPRGNFLLQTAAASSLGRMVIRLARHLGFSTLNIVRREDQVEAVRGAGGSHVHVFDGGTPEELQSIIRETTGEDRIRYAIDPVGGATGSAVAQCLAYHGRMLSFGTLDTAPLQFSPRSLMSHSARIEGFWLGSFMERVSLPYKLLLTRRITKLITSGVLSTEVESRFPLNNIQDAAVAAETPGRHGKTLLRINADS
jgi:NADPH:quinone reductase-like Zn-dependent oxidoreductase